jgi:hypothetical protein
MRRHGLELIRISKARSPGVISTRRERKPKAVSDFHRSRRQEPSGSPFSYDGCHTIMTTNGQKREMESKSTSTFPGADCAKIKPGEPESEDH